MYVRSLDFYWKLLISYAVRDDCYKAQPRGPRGQREPPVRIRPRIARFILQNTARSRVLEWTGNSNRPMGN